jgi:hypothetical protein
MTGRIEETSASFEARSAPRSYPTAGALSNERPYRELIATEAFTGIDRAAELIDENGGGPGVGLRKPYQRKASLPRALDRSAHLGLVIIHRCEN